MKLQPMYSPIDRKLKEEDVDDDDGGAEWVESSFGKGIKLSNVHLFI